LTADNQGHAKQPTLKVHSASNQILYFTGYICVPKDGTYTFIMRTDTGGLLRLHQATVIDAGYGYESGMPKKATIHLKAGLHPFRLYYMTRGETKPQLQLKWSGPGIPLQPIPGEVFYRNG